MGKTREIQCVNYRCEHDCGAGRDATFYRYCQTCDLYRAKRGSKPARKNTKRERIDAANRREYKY